ncbi:hypothetical protein ACFLQI_01555 [Candidatus Undinarchaeota archaeon]
MSKLKTATLITYDLPSAKMSQAEITAFHRRLYGYTDYSNHGKYQYERKGLLSEIPHLNPSQSVIIIPKNASEKVLGFLEEYGAKVFVIDVVLNKMQSKIVSS